MGTSPRTLMASIEIQPEFGYAFLVIQVVVARKKYGVQYPALYAPQGHKNETEFNSVQRAHQNTLENWASIQILMILNGLVNPRYAAGFGAVWVVGRVIYGFGYATGGPTGRRMGGIVSHLGDFPLLLMTFHTGASMAGLV